MSALFGEQDKQQNYSKKLDVHSRAIFTLIERQKALESSLGTIQEKIELLEHNIASLEKKSIRDNKGTRSDIQSVRKEMTGIKDFANKVQRELTSFAKGDEVKILEKYIELWDVMQFVTREELETEKQKMIDDVKVHMEQILQKILQDEKEE